MIFRIHQLFAIYEVTFGLEAECEWCFMFLSPLVEFNFFSNSIEILELIGKHILHMIDRLQTLMYLWVRGRERVVLHILVSVSEVEFVG